MPLPPILAANYRPATGNDVRGWSFGALKAPRRAGATRDDHVPGTLHDQAAFGPVRDHRCACGHYDGERFRGLICDRCGVKIAPASVRGERFGHVELPSDIEHPLSAEHALACFPVLPARFVESPAGAELAELYDRLAVAAAQDDAARAAQLVRDVAKRLTPVVLEAHRWGLGDAQRLARGLALCEIQGDRSKAS